jgi:hypothetical protein
VSRHDAGEWVSHQRAVAENAAACEAQRRGAPAHWAGRRPRPIPWWLCAAGLLVIGVLLAAVFGNAAG